MPIHLPDLDPDAPPPPPRVHTPLHWLEIVLGVLLVVVLIAIVFITTRLSVTGHIAP